MSHPPERYLFFRLLSYHQFLSHFLFMFVGCVIKCPRVTMSAASARLTLLTLMQKYLSRYEHTAWELSKGLYCLTLISTKIELTRSKKKGQSLEGWKNSARTKVCKRNSVLVGIPELETSWPHVNWTTLQGGSWLQTAGFTAYFQKSSSSLRPGFTQSACQGETQLLARTYMG